MNAPIHLAEQHFIEQQQPKKGLALDKKRYLWAISPALPAIGIGI